MHLRVEDFLSCTPCEYDTTVLHSRVFLLHSRMKRNVLAMEQKRVTRRIYTYLLLSLLGKNYAGRLEIA